MKTHKMLIVLFVLFLSPVLLPQYHYLPLGNEKTTNGWNYKGMWASGSGYILAESYLKKEEGQVFRTYGGMEYPYFRGVRTDWNKTFPSFLIPDTITLDCRFISGINPIQTQIGVYLGIQDSDRNSVTMSQDQFIPLDSTWAHLSWDMSKYTENFYVNENIIIILLTFWVFTQDSSDIIGMDIEVKNLVRIDNAGTFFIDHFRDSTTRVSELMQIPSKFALSQNYPNPFNPYTTIRFSIPQREQMSLIVFNLLGQKVKTLISEEKEQGNYEVNFNASKFPSGIYFYKLQAGSFVEIKKMILLK